mgnify:CR=1 FL=1
MGQEAGEDALAGTVHSIEADFVGESGQGFEVETRADIVLVEGLHVVDFDLAGGEKVFPGGSGERGRIGDKGFYFTEDGDRGRAAVRGFELVAEVGGGIMRGGEDDAQVALVLNGSEGNHRRGDEVWAEIDLDALIGEVGGDLLGEVARHEATVIADHDFGMGEMVFEPGGRAVGDAADIVEGEVPCDDGAPAVGTEANRGHIAKVRQAAGTIAGRGGFVGGGFGIRRRRP